MLDKGVAVVLTEMEVCCDGLTIWATDWEFKDLVGIPEGTADTCTGGDRLLGVRDDKDDRGNATRRICIAEELGRNPWPVVRWTIVVFGKKNLSNTAPYEFARGDTKPLM